MKDNIASAMEQAVADGVFPSADLLVAKEGSIFHHRQYGDARGGTCFDISSLTKPICTATLVMLLVEEDLLKLTDTVYQWLGGARLPEHRLITVEHLLNHTSGLPTWQPYFRELPLDLIGTESGRRFILDACYNEPLIHKPGGEVLYSDIGYIMLGEIIEQSGGASLDILFENMIGRSLNLRDTFFVKSVGSPISPSGKHGFATSDQHVPVPKHGQPGERHTRKVGEHRRFAPTEDCPWRERVVHGEVHDQNAYALGGVAGHAGLFSTAMDLHTFTAAFTSCYKGQGSFVPQGTLTRFFDFKLQKGRFIGGWDTPAPRNSAAGRHFSKQTIGHLGYCGCSIWIDLQRDYWVILLTNRIHPSITNEKIKAFRPQIHDLIYNSIF